MNNNENVKIRGIVTIKRYNRNVSSDYALDELVIRNKVVYTGIEYFASKSLGLTDNVIDIIGIGTGRKPVELTDVGLSRLTTEQNPIDHVTAYRPIRFKGLLGEVDAYGYPSEGRELYVETTFVEEDYVDEEVTEIGLFTNAVDGYDIPTEMIARTVIPPASRFIKTNADFLSISWRIILG